MKDFSQRLRNEREKKKKQDPKWTQGYVADLVGVARTTYTAYENGTKQPPMETVNKLADIFNVAADYLSGRQKDRISLNLTPEESAILEEIKKHPALFHDLSTNPQKKIKQLIKMWEFIRQDLEDDDENDDVIED